MADIGLQNQGLYTALILQTHHGGPNEGYKTPFDHADWKCRIRIVEVLKTHIQSYGWARDAEKRFGLNYPSARSAFINSRARIERARAETLARIKRRADG